jgi:hypothetical protein
MTSSWQMLARAALCAGAAVLAMPVCAQQVTLEPSAALRCLTPLAAARGAPEYPFDEWKRGQRGRVKVELEFTVADARPAVKVLESEGERPFVDAVREHVKAMRVPCLNEVGGSAKLVFDFVFKPDDRSVVWSDAVDTADAAREQMVKCLIHVSGKKSFDYPLAAELERVQGRVVARLRFEGPDRTPLIDVHARPNARLLTGAVEDWVKGYRMPCQTGPALVGYWTFLFKFQGEKAYGFQQLNLLQFMAGVRGVNQRRLAFDTNTMGCPFELRLHYRQPYQANGVAELGTNNAARRPLLEWLMQSELELPSRMLDAVFGDTAHLTVPCVKIDLKPKE